ncbi:MAG: aspartate kinase, partial [Ignavibacteria bacterium]
MKVLKFGGSSVANAERIKSVVDILRNYHNDKVEFAVVFSALGGITDKLITLAKTASKGDKSYLSLYQNIRLIHYRTIEELFSGASHEKVKNEISLLLEELNQIIHGIFLLKDISRKSLDLVLSFGEKLSCTIISNSMNDAGIPSSVIFSDKLIVTNSDFGNAKVNFELTNKNIKNHFDGCNTVQVVTGFIASDENGNITTLGRGGSDYTAAILGAALNADEIEIWTDVNGIMTADPRKVKNAIPLKAVTYNEAMELSHFGAKVIHPPTMLPAMEKGIRIRIKNTFNPGFKGTIILNKEPRVKFNAKGISSIDKISMLRIEGSGLISNRNATSRIFDALSNNSIPLLFITQGSSGYSLCIGVAPEFGQKAKECIQEELKLERIEGMMNEIVLEDDLSLIAVVGEDMRATPGISGTIFNSLGKNGINIKAIAQGSSELNVSCVVKSDELRKALNVIHNAMFLSKSKVVNIFLAGPGLVGSALLNYINKKLKFLQNDLSTNFRLIGITNSKKMLFDLNGVDFNSWKERLSNEGIDTAADKFIDKIIELDLANSIFIDCTANDSFVNHYKKILKHNISIVTPNKIA